MPSRLLAYLQAPYQGAPVGLAYLDGSVSRRAYKAEWDDGLVGCSSGLHNAERGPSGFGEAEATSGGGNGLVVTTTITK